MMIPSAVSKVLEEYKKFCINEEVEPRLIAEQEVPVDQIVKTVLMHDVLGRVHVIIPANCLLNIDQLNEKLGRSLVALPTDDLDALRASYSLTDLPALPDITGFPAIVDERVLGMDAIYLDSGERGQMLQLDRKLFAQVLRNARTENFTVLLKDIHVNRTQPAQDLEQINQAIQKFTYMRIKQRLEDTLELPPLPQSAQRIIHLRVDPDAGVGELADIVEADPSLSAQVVSWASSSFYAAPGKIKSVHDAIIRVLGFDLVMNLAMGLALGKTLQLPKERPEGYTPYWQQAIWMATATGALVNCIPRDQRPEFGLSYLSGLLHNFGYLVLAHVFPPHFSLICRYIEANPHLETAYIEHHLLGVTREQVGSKLMAVWTMPEEIIMALRHQNNPYFDGANSEYAALLYVAHNLLAEKGIAIGPGKPISDEVFERLHLDPEKARMAIDELILSKDDVLAMAGMMENA